MISKILYIFLFIELAAVAWIDYRYKKISNIWPLLNIIVFLFIIFSMKEVLVISWGSFYYPLIFFIVGFFFFTLRIMGGGDSKYLASFYLLIPVGYHENFLYCLLYVTITLGLVQFIYNTYIGRHFISDFIKYKNAIYLKKCYGKKFPFAPIIFLSWIIFGVNNINVIK